MITDAMVEQAAILAWCAPSYSGNEHARGTWADHPELYKVNRRAEARAVLEYAASLMWSERETNPLHIATLGPTREERLKDYRCAALSGLLGHTGIEMSDESVAEFTERLAHAMLAAERPADAPARDIDVRATVQAGIVEAEAAVLCELVAAHERSKARLLEGIRQALDALDVDIPDPAEVQSILRALLPAEKGTDDGQG